MAVKRRTPILKSDSTQVFYTDIQAEDMLFGALIRSEDLGRKVVALTLDDTVPEEYRAFTAKDIKGTNLITTEDTSLPVFAETVAYYGEPVGILVGPSEPLVHEYLSHITIEYEPLPEPELEILEDGEVLTEEEPVAEAAAVSEEQLEIAEETEEQAEITEETLEEFPEESRTETDSEAAEEEMEAAVYQESPFPELAGDIVYQRIVTTGPVDDYFRDSPNHVENGFANRITYTTCGELSGALVSSTSRTITFYTPTQWASHLRENAGVVTGYKRDDVKIKRTLCGASATNAVWYNTLLCCQAAVAAQGTGKPVKLTITPSEQRKYVEHSPTVSIIHHAAFLEDGTISAIKTRIVVEAGSGSPFIAQLIDRLAIAALGACKPLSQQVTVLAVRTPTAPTAASMQGADSLAFFALEALFQQIALTTGINPFEVHLKNFYPGSRTHEFLGNKIRTFHPYTIDTTPIVPLFEAITAESCFNRRYAAYNTVPLTRDSSLSTAPVRGIGMANSFEGHGYYGSAFDTLKQKLELTLENEKSVIIHAREPSRSISAIWKQMIAQELSIGTDDITYDPDYTLSDELELPETAKGNISIQTQLIRKCCTSLLRQRGKAEYPITVKKALTRSKNTVWDAKNFTGTPYYSVSWGTCVVELDIDSIAYEVNVRNIWIALDIGSVLDTKAAESSVLHACHEILRNVIRHRPLQCNDIHITLMTSDAESKQIGQLMYSILPAAFANALSQALRRQVTTLPVTDDILYRMIQEHADISIA
ncbi:MAG: molybdopterin-dependent oxidoreductase [Treponemataceae bacterium]|nr:molybdopterin-dependent oxidoreductase [Treponemataceae bacterium]